MRILLLCMGLLVSTSVWATEYRLTPGITRKVPVAVHLHKGTMVLSSKKPVSVMGKVEPSFKIDYQGTRMMIAVQQLGAPAHLYVDYGDGALAILELTAVTQGGDALVHLAPEKSGPTPKRLPPWKQAKATSLAFLAAPWNLKKLSSKAQSAGIQARARYALSAADQILLHLEIKNKRESTLQLADVSIFLTTLGGFKGTSTLKTQAVPASIHLESSTLDPGGKSGGTLILPKIYLAHDQVLLLHITDEQSVGPELRVAL